MMYDIFDGFMSLVLTFILFAPAHVAYLPYKHVLNVGIVWVNEGGTGSTAAWALIGRGGVV